MVLWYRYDYLPPCDLHSTLTIDSPWFPKSSFVAVRYWCMWRVAKWFCFWSFKSGVPYLSFVTRDWLLHVVVVLFFVLVTILANVSLGGLCRSWCFGRVKENIRVWKIEQIEPKNLYRTPENIWITVIFLNTLIIFT